MLKIAQNSALRAPAYRSWMAVLFISQLGTWGQVLAESWYAYQLTHSVWILGAIGAAAQLPFLLFSAAAGTACDRMDSRRLVTLTQCAGALQAAAFALFYFVHLNSLPVLIALVFAQGIINTYDSPARSNLVLRLLVDRDQHQSALAWSTTLFNVTRLIGPTCAGLIIAQFGEGACFVVNALSFLPVVGALHILRLTPETHHRRGGSFAEVIEHLRARPAVVEALLLMGATSFLIVPYMGLITGYADQTLGVAVTGVGLLMGAYSIGGILAALLVAKTHAYLATPVQLRVFAALQCAAGLALSIVHTRAVSPALWAALGLGVHAALVGSAQLLHREVPDALRGRASSLYTACIMVPIAAGSLVAGFVAEHLGVARLFGLNAVLLAAIVMAITWRARLSGEAAAVST